MTYEEFMANHETRMRGLNQEIEKLNRTLEENQQFMQEHDKKFKESNKSIKGSENGWAAAIEYYIKKAAGETVTQVQVSEKYEVSPSTLGKRYKALRVS